MATTQVSEKYVAFCDILGFSAAVLSGFDAAMQLYQEFRRNLHNWPLPEKAQVSVYSDSIVVVADELPAVINTVVSLNWAALSQNWLIRGGIAHGRYWEEKERGNLFVVSDALVRAVAIEKSVKVPAVVVSNEILLGIEAWVPRFQYGAFRAPLLYFDGHSLVNPFNEYWFESAKMRVQQMLVAHPAHGNKYRWFLSLADAVRRDDILVPEAALQRMLELGVLVSRAPTTG